VLAGTKRRTRTWILRDEAFDRGDVERHQTDG
jgi:hypothetical protein